MRNINEADLPTTVAADSAIDLLVLVVIGLGLAIGGSLWSIFMPWL